MTSPRSRNAADSAAPHPVLDNLAEQAAAEQASTVPEVVEESAPNLLEQMGGISGLLYSSVPLAVVLLVNSFAGLTPAIWAAVGTAVAIAAIRLLRRESLQPAVSGLFGVAVGAYLAHRTGSAKGFALLGIWFSLVYAGVFLVSVVVRWPLAGVIWSMLNGHGFEWRKDRRIRFAYDVATLAWTAVFVARYVVQQWLYDSSAAGVLLAVKLAMGYPLTAVALLVTVWMVRRATRAHHVAEQALHQPAS